MYYKKIEGHFNFEEIYDKVLAEVLGKGDVLVEVGSYFGKSTCYMAEKVKQLHIEVEFHAVDTFVGSPDDQKLLKRIKKLGGDIYPVFIDNMNKAGVMDIITVHRMSSLEAANLFGSESLFFGFLDAAHDYKSVKSDMEVWYPKIKNGCIFAGHDYGNRILTGVDKAVHERFGSDFELIENSWLHRKHL